MTNIQPLPLAMTADNLRRVIATFRALPGASITIKPALVEVLDPRGTIVFRAIKAGAVWTAAAKPGLINATFA